MRVVLIDDTHEVRQLLAEILSQAGHEIVAEAADGRSGVEHALAHQPDLVVTNWRMPEMDGVTATAHIRSGHPDVAIVALSSTRDPALCEAFIHAGADACVHKSDIRGFMHAVRTLESDGGERARTPNSGA